MTTVTVELKDKNPETLLAALKEAGYEANINVYKGKKNVYFSKGRESGVYQDGELTISKNVDISEIKQSYAAEILKQNAKKYGWALKSTGKFQYQVTKR